LFLFFAALFFAQNANAQKTPDCLLAAKLNRPTHVLVSLSKLGNFHKNFSSVATSFKETKIVKSELAYYLMATDKNSTDIYVFELELKGKKLYLNRTLPVQTCSEGEFSLDTFLQDNGKIIGCRIGKHTIKQRSNNQ
ncbi:MAG: hypothetical protein MUC59_16070, partial [Saprospiraceae bacterium]|nr:hypothetical protein [Saprospiraceae bacterium]